MRTNEFPYRVLVCRDRKSLGFHSFQDPETIHMCGSTESVEEQAAHGSLLCLPFCSLLNQVGKIAIYIFHCFIRPKIASITGQEQGKALCRKRRID